MKSLLLSLPLIALLLSTANAEESIILGRAVSNKYIENVDPPCPTDSLCMDGWFRWTIKPETTLNGPKLAGRIMAVRVQHAEFVPRYQRKLKLFILAPIESKEKRQLLGADYYLRDMSIANEMYCLDKNTSYPEIELKDRFIAQSTPYQYCFKLP